MESKTCGFCVESKLKLTSNSCEVLVKKVYLAFFFTAFFFTTFLAFFLAAIE
jgi:hypothetical protein